MIIKTTNIGNYKEKTLLNGTTQTIYATVYFNSDKIEYMTDLNGTFYIGFGANSIKVTETEFNRIINLLKGNQNG